MRILFYADARDPEGARLRELLLRIVPPSSLESFFLLGGLAMRLQQSRGERPLAVLLFNDRDRLTEVATLSPAFDGTQVVLVLPDQEDETLRAAHLLHPRYTTHRSGEYADLLAVIRRKCSPEGTG